MDATFDRLQSLYDAAEPDWTEEEDPMDRTTVAETLEQLIAETTYMDAEDAEATFSVDVSGLIGATVTSYEAAGVLTRDAGFVIRMEDGSEYQVTVVRSR